MSDTQQSEKHHDFEIPTISVNIPSTPLKMFTNLEIHQENKIADLQCQDEDKR